ncbi:hypothetical protein [Faecalispora jeddahensis]|uniref:hypothetical protein n=1 Tax=Faecalispora jeddahensis TaxID=1414721 RepID=UPI0004B37606|nr:hypothetical protein [Faecalispora jeddahensis]
MPDITTLFEGTDGATRENFNQKLSDVNAHGNDTAAHITTALHTRTGTTNNLDIPDGAKNLTFLATADLADGDTWTVNGSAVTAVLQNGEPLPGDLFKAGCWVTGVRLSDDGTQLFFRAGASTVPSIFGNGSDGDAVISGTVTLPVPVAHQSIVEKQYKSLTINAGAILKCATFNAGLIIRVQGDCIIHGTIDQSGLAPKTNPQNNYPYPAQLVCGNGGNGGDALDKNGNLTIKGGVAMLKRPYGGGYGAGAAGGRSDAYNGYAGGDSTNITIEISSIFNGYTDRVGTYGGGGPGNSAEGRSGTQGRGGSGPGGNGGNATDWASGGGGGAGNYGGGVIMLFVMGRLIIDGSILCNGLPGGAGGKITAASNARDGSGGGGGGGGAIYIYHKGEYVNAGVLQVNGGAGGTGATNGIAGGVGSITVIQQAA